MYNKTLKNYFKRQTYTLRYILLSIEEVCDSLSFIQG